MTIVMLMTQSMSSMERKFWEKGSLLSTQEAPDVTDPVTGTEVVIEEGETPELHGWTNTALPPGPTTGWWSRT